MYITSNPRGLKGPQTITIHTAQWLTLDKVVIDIRKEVLRFLHDHVCSDIMFNPPLVYQCVASLVKTMWLTEHKC